MKKHIGDGVYAEIDEFGNIRLTTKKNGPRSLIILEPQMWRALLNFIRSQNEAEAVK